MDLLNYDSRRYFVFWIRIFFGIWLLYAGLFKWFAIGPTGFVNMITGDFDKTWSPHPLNVFLAWVILIAEPLLSLWILTGIRQRLAWTLTSLLMFELVAGQSLLMKPDVIYNWMYLVLTVTCAALSEPQRQRSE
jgi:uncharacterized membrane protein YphA (DoxX/SURF4 family)